MSEQSQIRNPSKTSPFVVKPPFHSDSPGDCIIQTADGTQFVVYRVILSLASSVWNDMFTLPQSSEVFSGEHPVIPVDEDPETMEALLKMLYPLPSPRVKSYDLAIKLVQACDKYFIDVSRLDTILYKVLRTTAALEADPLGVYALAWRLGMEDEAKVASRYTHRIDLNDTKIRSDLIRRSGSVNSLAALWDLRFRRETALDDLTKLARVQRDRGGHESQCYQHGLNYLNVQWTGEDHLSAKSSVRQALQDPYPTCHTMKQLFGIDFPPQGYGCGGCHGSAEAKHGVLVRSINAALDSYPQTITRILPDI